MLKKLLPLTLFVSLAAHAQSPWQGEWGSFNNAKDMVGGRLSISACSADACQFSIERGSGTGHIDTASDNKLTLLSPTSALATLTSGTAPAPCVLQFTRQISPKPAILVSASGPVCMSYYGRGTNVNLFGTYPLRSTVNYAWLHRDECFFDNSPARLAICTTPSLADLERHWQDMAWKYPPRPVSKNEDAIAIADKEDTTILNTCDKDAHPTQCLNEHYTAEIHVMQAKQNTRAEGTIERGDAAQGHALALEIAGRYRHTFANGDVQGDKYKTTDTMTIKPVGAASIAFDIELNFFNGHTCSINGGALYRKDGSFVFDDTPENKIEDEPLCRLAIVPSSKGVTFSDITGGCKSYCGARGSLDGGGFTFTQRVATTPAKK